MPTPGGREEAKRRAVSVIEDAYIARVNALRLRALALARLALKRWEGLPYAGASIELPHILPASPLFREQALQVLLDRDGRAFLAGSGDTEQRVAQLCDLEVVEDTDEAFEIADECLTPHAASPTHFTQLLLSAHVTVSENNGCTVYTFPSTIEARARTILLQLLSANLIGEVASVRPVSDIEQLKSSCPSALGRDVTLRNESRKVDGPVQTQLASTLEHSSTYRATSDHAASKRFHPGLAVDSPPIGRKVQGVQALLVYRRVHAQLVTDENTRMHTESTYIKQRRKSDQRPIRTGNSIPPFHGDGVAGWKASPDSLLIASTEWNQEAKREREAIEKARCVQAERTRQIKDSALLSTARKLQERLDAYRSMWGHASIHFPNGTEHITGEDSSRSDVDKSVRRVKQVMEKSRALRHLHAQQG